MATYSFSVAVDRSDATVDALYDVCDGVQLRSTGSAFVDVDCDAASLEAVVDQAIAEIEPALSHARVARVAVDRAVTCTPRWAPAALERECTVGQVRMRRRRPAIIALVLVVLALSGCGSGQPTAAECKASVVEAGHGIPIVVAGEIEGRLFYAEPSAVGRPATMPAGGQVAEGRNTKVLWVAEPGGGPLQMRGERTDGEGAFGASVPEALAPGGHYPSIIDVPEPGCWELTVSTAESSGTFTFLSRR